MARIASLRPHDRFYARWPEEVSVEEMLPATMGLLDQAGQEKADLTVLPEDFLFQQTAAEPLDGPIATALSQKARQHRMNVAACMCLSEAGRRYNATVIFDRRGRFVGRYDKTHLTKKEREAFGLTPGDGLPVFDLDIGRVGVMTCADFLFPEVARSLALDGARLILFPHQQAEPSAQFQRMMLQSRAQDNCVYIVCCSFAATPQRAYFPNWVFGPDGCILAEGPGGEGVTLVDLDLEQKVILRDYIEFGEVDLWDIIRRYRRPELYGRIAQSSEER